MLKTIWFMWRPGEERTYAMTVQPDQTWAAIQKRDGFHLISFEVDIPDPTVEDKLGTVKPPLTGIVHVDSSSSGATEFAPMDEARAREVSKANPESVVPVLGADSGLVALCADFSLYQDGSVARNDELVFRMTGKTYPRYLVKPGYTALASRPAFQSLVSWWYINVCKVSVEIDAGDRVHIADQVAHNISALSPEEAAVRRPGVVVETGSIADGVVAFCGKYSLYKNGAILLGGVLVAQVRDAPDTYLLRAELSPGDSECVAKLSAWWHTKFECMPGQPCCMPPGTITS